MTNAVDKLNFFGTLTAPPRQAQTLPGRQVQQPGRMQVTPLAFAGQPQAEPISLPPKDDFGRIYPSMDGGAYVNKRAKVCNHVAIC